MHTTIELSEAADFISALDHEIEGFETTSDDGVYQVMGVRDSSSGSWKLELYRQGKMIACPPAFHLEASSAYGAHVMARLILAKIETW